MAITGKAQHRRTHKGKSAGRTNTVTTHTAQTTHLDAIDWPARNSSEARAVLICTVSVACLGKNPASL